MPRSQFSGGKIRGRRFSLKSKTPAVPPGNTSRSTSPTLNKIYGATLKFVKRKQPDLFLNHDKRSAVRRSKPVVYAVSEREPTSSPRRQKSMDEKTDVELDELALSIAMTPSLIRSKSTMHE